MHLIIIVSFISCLNCFLLLILMNFYCFVFSAGLSDKVHFSFKYIFLMLFFLEIIKKLQIELYFCFPTTFYWQKKKQQKNPISRMFRMENNTAERCGVMDTVLCVTLQKQSAKLKTSNRGWCVVKYFTNYFNIWQIDSFNF